jgi:GNAT superfamily N-acetyltransferase
MSLQNSLQLNAALYEGEGYDAHFENHFPFDASETDKYLTNKGFRRLPKKEQLRYARWMYMLENGPLFKISSTNPSDWVTPDVEEIKIESHTRYCIADVVVYKPKGDTTSEEYKNIDLPIAHIYAFLINPFLTGKGFGQRAFRKLEDYLKTQHNVNYIFLDPLERDKKTDPEPFWKALGFKFPTGQELQELPDVNRKNEPSFRTQTRANHMWKSTESSYKPLKDAFDTDFDFKSNPSGKYFFAEREPTLMIARPVSTSGWPMSELSKLIKHFHPSALSGIDDLEPLVSGPRGRTRRQTQRASSRPVGRPRAFKTDLGRVNIGLREKKRQNRDMIEAMKARVRPLTDAYEAYKRNAKVIPAKKAPKKGKKQEFIDLTEQDGPDAETVIIDDDDADAKTQIII